MPKDVARVEAFVAEITELARAAAYQTLSSALEGGQLASGRGAPPILRGRRYIDNWRAPNHVIELRAQHKPAYQTTLDAPCALSSYAIVQIGPFPGH